MSAVLGRMIGWSRLVVVDVETTGFGKADRVVEVAAVTLSPDGETLDEWESLVDPQRDVGPTWLHGITASMVANAPTFQDIGHALAKRLDGSVLVAHNLGFDARFVAQEYERVGAGFHGGRGVDTLSLVRAKLPDACSRYGIRYEGQHRALQDARAVVELMRCLIEETPVKATTPARVEHALPFRPRTHRREAFGASTGTAPKPPYLGHLASHLQHEHVDARALPYLEVLDWALADLTLDSYERRQLSWLAQSLALNPLELDSIHRVYMEELVEAALRDGVVTDDEERQLRLAADALDVPWHLISDRVEARREQSSEVALAPGSRVCFTGAIPSHVAELGFRTREDLCAIAERSGLVPVSGVTKKGCDLLVAADVHTSSGKAKAARSFGIPVMSTEDFLRQLGQDV